MRTEVFSTVSKWLLVVVLFAEHGNGDPEHGKNLRRVKRWINFPKGSSLQLVYCWLISTYGTRDGIFTVGITVGLAWEIPEDLRKAEREGLARRDLHDTQRRELHRKIKRFIDQQGKNGTSCVQKALCDAAKLTQPQKRKFTHALLYTIFKLDGNDSEETAGCNRNHDCEFDWFGNERLARVIPDQ